MPSLRKGELLSEALSGYITSVSYIYGFYKELTPSILRLSSLSRGFKSNTDFSDQMTYCELGYGQGFTANLLAAANPEMEIYATDFNPAHAYNAQHFARIAQLSNAHFFDNSFAEFDARADLPQFNIIALHGIYSWIAKEHRQKIVHFIEKRLKPGGLVYISYNCLPGWAGAAPIRHLMRLYAEKSSGTLSQKIDSSLSFMERLREAGARYFKSTPGLNERIERLKKANRNYIAHEYLNSDWELFYHSDIASDLSQARLSYIGSANIFDHLDNINLTAEQQEILKDVVDPIMYETLRDYMVNQTFRKDVFARGAIPLSIHEAREEWLNSRFALATPAANVPMTLKVPLGELALDEGTYRPIISAFEDAEGGTCLRQIMSRKEIAGLDWSRLQRIVLTLVGAGYLQPCPSGTLDDAKRKESAQKFNSAVILQSRYSDDLKFLASPVTGGGIPVSLFSRLFLLALRENEKEPITFAWNILKQQDYKLVKDGKILPIEDGNFSFIEEKYESFQKSIPTLRRLGIV